MEKVTPRTLSGFKDRLPQEALKKRDILHKLSQVFESFGFAPIETPHLEYADVLLKRGSEEIQKELYRFKDHGDRDVALRFDLTVPLARFATQHRHAIKLPFKRYAIGNVFRGERAQAGRYREFTQCDFDFLGSDSLVADAETIAVLEAGFLTLGIKEFKISINNRAIMNGFAASLGLEGKIEDILRIVDKLDKIGRESVLKELEECGIDSGEEIVEFVSLKESDKGFWEKVAELKQNPLLQKGFEDIVKLTELLESMGVDRSRVQIDLSIARGLGYYTGIVYESRLTRLPEIGSVASGGRYDNLTQTFSNEKISGVGASFGVDRLLAALDKLGELDSKETPSLLLGISFCEKSQNYLLKACSILRKEGIACEVYPDIAKLKKQLDFANSKGFPYVLIAGESEVHKNIFVLKDMKSGEQKSLDLDGVLSEIKGVL